MILLFLLAMYVVAYFLGTGCALARSAIKRQKPQFPTPLGFIDGLTQLAVGGVLVVALH